MSDDFSKDIFISTEERNPVKSAQKDARAPQPKRFYTQVDVAPDADGFAVTLDGRKLKTPAQSAVVLPTRAAARALAAEWAAQQQDIDPRTMPLTRLVNSAIDGVARDVDAVIADIVKYAGSDLVCYRAAEPAALVAAQAAAWDPVLDLARDRVGARFICTIGVTFVEQPARTLQAITQAVAQSAGTGAAQPFAVAALHVMTTLTGSVLLALAVAERDMSTEAAWKAAHVDEDFQMRAWGADAEALARREKRWMEFESAVRLFELVRT
ncbi:MAG: ATP12 family chaperone protein [Beijerinckiaceae bacterium]